MTNGISFVVAHDDLSRHQLVDETLHDPADGELLLRVDRFAFTANNLTYAEMGERMAYWQFFPAPEGWGNIPVWGFADVVESRHSAFARGERVYGFLPMSTHVMLRPDRIEAASFIDTSAQRSKLPSAYNLYLRTAGDPVYRTQYEDLQALLRPVFITSFLIDDMLADDAFHGAGRVLIASASSKTAIGLSHLLHSRSTVEVAALTSTRNRSFVAGLGCYDRVLTYDEVLQLPLESTIYVDFAGSAPVQQAVHERLAEKLVFSSAVGFTHRDAAAPAADLPGAKPSFFFAPDRLKKRAKDWGRDGIDQRLTEKWLGFVPVAERWFSIVRGDGSLAVKAVYAAALAGAISPSEGHVLSL